MDFQFLLAPPHLFFIYYLMWRLFEPSTISSFLLVFTDLTHTHLFAIYAVINDEVLLSHLFGFCCIFADKLPSLVTINGGHHMTLLYVCCT
jgi:hypothetical protein